MTSQLDPIFDHFPPGNSSIKHLQFIHLCDLDLYLLGVPNIADFLFVKRRFWTPKVAKCLGVNKVKNSTKSKNQKKIKKWWKMSRDSWLKATFLLSVTNISAGTAVHCNTIKVVPGKVSWFNQRRSGGASCINKKCTLHFTTSFLFHWPLPGFYYIEFKGKLMDPILKEGFRLA